MSSGGGVFAFVGGNAQSQVTDSSDQGLTVNANPLFQFAPGTITSSPTDTATTSPSQSIAPQQLLEPPGTQGITAPVLTSAAASTPLSSSTLLILALGIGAVMLFSGGSHGGSRR